MSMKSIKNKPHRDGFDLSFKNAFTAKLGELLPICCQEVIPGDKFKIRSDWFTRTQPVTSPAYTRFGEYYDWFFVPYHLLWRYFPQMVIQTNDDNWATSISSKSSTPSHPYFSNYELVNSIRSSVSLSGSVPSSGSTDSRYVVSTGTSLDRNGFAVSYGACKLLSYLGYGDLYTSSFPFDNTNSSNLVEVPLIDSDFSSPSSISSRRKNVNMNPFPLAAYQKIYQDFYRNSQWEAPSPWTYNFDYLSGASNKVTFPSFPSGNPWYSNCLYTLRYSNFNKDYFLGRLPEKQYGSEALASPITYNGTENVSLGNLNGFDNTFFANPDTSFKLFSRRSNDSFSVSVSDFELAQSASESIPVSVSPATLQNIFTQAGVGALALRQAEYLQKWKEITQSGGTDYVSQILKHFGVKPSAAMAHRCTYLGGFDKKFGIDEVTNTNLSSDTAEASLFGKGVNGGSGSIDFEAKEHGILMCIYHTSLLPEYSSLFTSRLSLKTQPTDYAIPELDNVGMQPVYSGEFSGFNNLAPSGLLADYSTKIIGYVPRYAEYKTNVDVVRGAFSRTLFNWVTPLNNDHFRLGLTPNFSNPSSRGDGGRYLSSTFYKLSPRYLDGVFSVNCDSTPDTDQFLVNCNFDIKAVRNISRDGLPY